MLKNITVVWNLSRFSKFCDFRLEDDDDDEDLKKSQARSPSHPGTNTS